MSDSSIEKSKIQTGITYYEKLSLKFNITHGEIFAIYPFNQTIF